ncbi:MAG: hypothetical protein KatS3mg110_3962 [Pirellulaceae bacterium]|nr:MAG: hypothetical protein KatS3mg110_3962 [Pirellulaceae bacterium]
MEGRKSFDAYRTPDESWKKMKKVSQYFPSINAAGRHAGT